MSSAIAQSLILGSAKMAVEQVSLNPAAWADLSERGLVTVERLSSTSPAVIVTISEAGRAASLLAADVE
jgi:hypothetical protein